MLTWGLNGGDAMHQSKDLRMNDSGPASMRKQLQTDRPSRPLDSTMKPLEMLFYCQYRSVPETTIAIGVTTSV